MSAATRLYTAREVEQLRERCELYRGELRMMTPAGADHGFVIANVAAALHRFVRGQQLGRVFGAETGFLLERDPDTVRAPDVAVILGDRPASDGSTSFATVTPDLVVEVLSPSDSWGEVEAKTEWWLARGVSQVWLVDPRARLVEVVTAAGRRSYHAADTIAGGDLLPGFTAPLSDFFA